MNSMLTTTIIGTLHDSVALVHSVLAIVCTGLVQWPIQCVGSTYISAKTEFFFSPSSNCNKCWNLPWIDWFLLFKFMHFLKCTLREKLWDDVWCLTLTPNRSSNIDLVGRCQLSCITLRPMLFDLLCINSLPVMVEYKISEQMCLETYYMALFSSPSARP